MQARTSVIREYHARIRVGTVHPAPILLCRSVGSLDQVNKALAIVQVAVCMCGLGVDNSRSTVDGDHALYEYVYGRRAERFANKGVVWGKGWWTPKSRMPSELSNSSSEPPTLNKNQGPGFSLLGTTEYVSRDLLIKIAAKAGGYAGSLGCKKLWTLINRPAPPP